MVRNDLRNVAIIAHVDHGKTTLVDAMLRQSGAFRDNQAVAERVMDSGDIERERGITILAKNCSCTYKGVKINIVDTPGHADFGGEVERVLKMVNGVLLLVDAAEGCMPQTRFVLQKALQQNLSLVVAINKIDRPDARIKEVIDEVLYLLMDLGATDEQLDCPMLFCCGRDGTASLDPDVPGTDLVPLFDTLLSTIKPPEGDPEAPFQMLVSSVDYNEFVGRIGIGRIQNGVAKVGEEVVVCDWHNPDLKMRGRLTKLYDFQANGRQPCDNITAGDIVEIGTSDEIYYDPRHPYTWALLSSMPQMGIKGEDLFNIQGTPPNLFTEIHGDAFAPRNPQALKIDFVKRPPYFTVSPTHKAKTWLLDPRAPKVEPPAAVKLLKEEGMQDA